MRHPGKAKMKDFIQTNFPELLLTLIIIALVVVLLFAIHWHDDSTASWARTSIAGVILSIATLFNSLKQPRPNGTSTVTNTNTPEQKEKP